MTISFGSPAMQVPADDRLQIDASALPVKHTSGSAVPTAGQGPVGCMPGSAAKLRTRMLPAGGPGGPAQPHPGTGRGPPAVSEREMGIDLLELARHSPHAFWDLLTRTAAVPAAHTLMRVCLAGQ